MPFKIIEGDITKLNTDAIVNAANSTLLGGGGVDGSIHRTAGPHLLEECRTLNGCQTGEAKITNGYNLPSKKVIHTVGPIWQGGFNREPELLKSCYKNSLELAKENNIESIAFPLISAGVYGYPKDKAIEIATETIQDFLDENDMDVSLVIYNKSDFELDNKLIEEIDTYINQINNGLNTFSVSFEPSLSAAYAPIVEEELFYEKIDHNLEKMINNKKESFSEYLFKKIDESGLTDPQCYRKANLDRRLFSKIRRDPNYSPSKETVIALAIALELSLEETIKLLNKAGFTLSDNKLFDIIIQYFIENGNYNIFKINEALFYYNQKLLV